jgi:hypothetical protein
MLLRRLVALAAALASLSCVSAAVSFDATSSDLVTQFRLLDEQGAAASTLSYAADDLPTAVASRLATLGLDFAQLGGLQQRALLWDTGYVVGPDGSALVRIYTTGGASMADIGVTQDEYLGTGCTFSNCSDSAGRETKRSRYCNGAQIATVVRCAATDVPGADQDLSMWATGAANATAVPSPNVVRHDWVDDYSNISYLVFAIHMASPSAQPSWDECAIDGGGDFEAAMIIPCDVYSAANASQWGEPESSALMTAWLEETAAQVETSSEDGGGGFNLLYLIPILAGALLLALLAACVFVRRRRKAERRRMWDASDANLDTAVSSNYFSGK